MLADGLSARSVIRMTEQATGTFLSQTAYDRLRAELTELEGPGRASIVAKIEEAREEGDLKENGGYHAAKDEQGKIEARIRQLSQLLRTAQVGVAPEFDGRGGPGTVVTVRFPTGDESRFLVGSREDSIEGLDVYSPKSPIGSAVTGCSAGETASYTTPTGKDVSIQVLMVEPFTG